MSNSIENSIMTSGETDDKENQVPARKKVRITQDSEDFENRQLIEDVKNLQKSMFEKMQKIENENLELKEQLVAESLQNLQKERKFEEKMANFEETLEVLKNYTELKMETENLEMKERQNALEHMLQMKFHETFLRINQNQVTSEDKIRKLEAMIQPKMAKNQNENPNMVIKQEVVDDDFPDNSENSVPSGFLEENRHMRQLTNAQIQTMLQNIEKENVELKDSTDRQDARISLMKRDYDEMVTTITEDNFQLESRQIALEQNLQRKFHETFLRINQNQVASEGRIQKLEAKIEKNHRENEMSKIVIKQEIVENEIPESSENSVLSRILEENRQLKSDFENLRQLSNGNQENFGRIQSMLLNVEKEILEMKESIQKLIQDSAHEQKLEIQKKKSEENVFSIIHQAQMSSENRFQKLESMILEIDEIPKVPENPDDSVLARILEENRQLKLEVQSLRQLSNGTIGSFGIFRSRLNNVENENGKIKESIKKEKLEVQKLESTISSMSKDYEEKLNALDKKLKEDVSMILQASDFHEFEEKLKELEENVFSKIHLVQVSSEDRILKLESITSKIEKMYKEDGIPKVPENPDDSVLSGILEESRQLKSDVENLKQISNETHKDFGRIQTMLLNVEKENLEMKESIQKLIQDSVDEQKREFEKLECTIHCTIKDYDPSGLKEKLEELEKKLKSKISKIEKHFHQPINYNYQSQNMEMGPNSNPLYDVLIGQIKSNIPVGIDQNQEIRHHNRFAQGPPPPPPRFF